jgi:hypothetical protein
MGTYKTHLFGGHPSEPLAKLGYVSEIKYKTLIVLLYFDVYTKKTKCMNLMIFFNNYFSHFQEVLFQICEIT